MVIVHTDLVLPACGCVTIYIYSNKIKHNIRKNVRSVKYFVKYCVKNAKNNKIIDTQAYKC